MSDFYEPYERLIPVVVLGRVLHVPENNLLLRQMQFAAPDIGCGRYCWNGECRYCEISYRQGSGEIEHAALACRVKGLEGMRVTKLSSEMKYNMSETLSTAPPDPEPPKG
jgi:hypothetical protein